MKTQLLSIKTNLLTALGICQKFPSGTFYSVTASRFNITCQGEGSEAAFKLAKSLDFYVDDNPNLKYYQFRSGDIYLVFSDFDLNGNVMPSEGA